MGEESSRRVKESRRRKKVEKEIEVLVLVLELDEMCISFKKMYGCGQQ